VVIVKGTFDIAGGRMAPAAEQEPLRWADEYWGQPGESSVRYECDAVPFKTGTDVVMAGHAYAGKGRTAHVDVSLQVGALRKTARVFGDRKWTKGRIGKARISDPEPFERLPLIYELAFGGQDLTGQEPQREARNPVGRGFIGQRGRRAVDGLPLPNIENPAQLIDQPGDHPEPVGFGFVARDWQPRVALAGTYDSVWEKERSPLLPADFNKDYFNGAPAGLVSRPCLQGGEPVEIVNASQPSPLRFSLPTGGPQVRMLMGEAPFSLALELDTLIIEPDALKIVAIWRGGQDVHGRLSQVEGLEVSLGS
jgi:hypothetical protein